MEILEDIVEVALITVIYLGIPVVVLFIIGYHSYRANLEQPAPEGRHGKPYRDGQRPNFGKEPDRPPPQSTHQLCWQHQHCPPETREACAAFCQPDLPCWRAVKTSLGRLKAECPGCELFLTLPATRSKEVRIMGAAFFIGLVLIAIAAIVTVVGFAIYGVFLGFNSLTRLCRR